MLSRASFRPACLSGAFSLFFGWRKERPQPESPRVAAWAARLRCGRASHSACPARQASRPHPPKLPLLESSFTSQHILFRIPTRRFWGILLDNLFIFFFLHLEKIICLTGGSTKF